MRSGLLCKSCGNECRDLPTEAEPIEIECVVCDGLDDDCEACNRTGRMPIRTCPREFIGAIVTRAVNMISHAMQGSFPVTGGVLDQSAQFIRAMDYLRAQHNRIDAERIEAMKRGR